MNYGFGERVHQTIAVVARLSWVRNARKIADLHFIGL